MTTPDQLLQDAEAAERLAAVVSYRRDKEHLLQQAAELRRKARAAEERSWSPGQPN